MIAEICRGYKYKIHSYVKNFFTKFTSIRFINIICRNFKPCRITSIEMQPCAEILSLIELITYCIYYEFKGICWRGKGEVCTFFP